MLWQTKPRQYLRIYDTSTNEVFNRKIRSIFTTQFKLEVTCLIVEQKYSYPEVCRALDVRESSLRRRVTQLQKERVARHLNQFL